MLFDLTTNTKKGEGNLFNLHKHQAHIFLENIYEYRDIYFLVIYVFPKKNLFN